MADAGRAMMLYRGMYDSTYTYEKLDVVNFNGSLYISTTDGNLGTEPTDGTKWKLFLQGGVADNIQATDTHGLVGEAGESSFVQLLLDSLASRVGKDGNGNVIEDTYLQKTAVLNTLEEIDANTSEANIAGALALKKSIVKSTCVYAFAIPNEELDSDNAIGKFRFVVPISVDYSGINGKILSTSLIHIGTDSTDANGGLSKSLLLAEMGGDGSEKIIKNILVYSKDYQTVRVKILVEYVEN